jgi:hypothetical protein
MKLSIVAYTFMFNILVILIFSVIYSFISIKNFEPLHPKNKLTYLDFLFYSVTIQSGVGLSDVNSVSNTSKILAIIQQLTLMGSAFILLEFGLNK